MPAHAPLSSPPLLRWVVLLIAALGGRALAQVGDHEVALRTEPMSSLTSTMPDWAVGAVFYQVFPERFCNGDATNDPTRQSLESPDRVPANWAVSPWTGDWYARAAWEKSLGADFFEHGVFDRRYGGDLQGVIDKLDYLQDLGVDALYLNPVFFARSLHKYDGAAFHHIDPHFGPDPAGDFEAMSRETPDPATWRWTAADKLFLELLRRAHDRNIRIVVDGVFNHTGREFFAFADLRKKQEQSIYKDWYIVQSFDNPATDADEFAYRGWWGVESLPEFADNAAGDNLHPGPKEYILAVTRRWMDPDGDGDPSDGVDGWRLDCAGEAPVGFWQEWHRTVRRINPHAYTVAEHWLDAADFVRQAGFSATMNYHGFAFPIKGFLVDDCLSPSDAARMLVERAARFPADTRGGLMSLVDSHDTDRLASMIVNAQGDHPYAEPDRFDYDVSSRVSPRLRSDYDLRKPTARERRIQRMVAVMQATYPGAPTFYYGTEAGMWGADDPCDRMPMVWPHARHDDQQAHPGGADRSSDPVAFDHELHRFYRSLIQLRRGSPALQRGVMSIVATDDAQRVLAFRRSDGNRTCLAVFNRGESAAEVALPVPTGAYDVVFTASGAPSQSSSVRIGETLNVRLPGLEAVMLELQPTDR